MSHSYNFTPMHTDGAFEIVEISSSSNVLLYGAYYGSCEGHLWIPEGAELTTQIISELHTELMEKYPPQVWRVIYDRTSLFYKELKEMFESVGLLEKDHL